MAVKLTHDVFCDGCGMWVHAFVRRGVAIREAREIAHDMDWVTKRTAQGQIDLCPDCQQSIADGTMQLDT